MWVVDSGRQEAWRRFMDVVKDDVKLVGVRDRCRLKGQVEPADWLWPP